MWRHSNGRYIRSLDTYGGGQLRQVREKFVLGHLAPSPLHLCEICQDEVAVQAVLGRLKGSHWRWLSICRQGC